MTIRTQTVWCYFIDKVHWCVWFWHGVRLDKPAQTQRKEWKEWKEWKWARQRKYWLA